MALDAAIVRLRQSGDLAAALRHRSLELPAERPRHLSPAQCVLITDSLDAVESARSAGLVCLAVGASVDAFRAAGARAVYADPDDLIAHLDDALNLASPGSAHLTQSAMESLMRRALDAARTGMDAGEAPIGCVLARGDGSVIASGHNEMNRTQNKTAHAEIVAFARAAGRTPLDARDLIMVSTLEPCVMCTGAAMEAAVDTILYAMPAPADAGTRRVACPTSPESQTPRIVGGILEKESRALFEELLRRNPRPEQAAFARQLLDPTG
jgi:tRNA(Arg) A34 adenosine deaminase TadA